ncbi:hypothetical protein FSP39_002322 [Pinctada imbricata]|uniref:PABS domain-containing protein n=1 Tax=Pinctada imbricata TaxID=66713 RepID=A0AA88Y213_PINIB|nr:hypothetical protein FSP39_002322 [Pinctada imbricata]
MVCSWIKLPKSTILTIATISSNDAGKFSNFIRILKYVNINQRFKCFKEAKTVFFLGSEKNNASAILVFKPSLKDDRLMDDGKFLEPVNPFNFIIRQVLIHIYPTGLVTVDVQRFVLDDNTKKNQEIAEAKKLEYDIKQSLGDVCINSRCPPGQIKRSNGLHYFSTGDDRLCEYVDGTVVFEKDSKWQNIKILHTNEFGHVLFLDDDLMIAESDMLYTSTLLGLDRNNFEDKTVLILGGGDGGLLHELLKRRVGHVTMVEIDEEVIKACRTHMRSVCQSAMDVYEGPNYKIIVDDCMVILKESLRNRQRYDYVINDLTEFSIESDNFCNYDFNTTSTILEISSQLLKPGGKYLSRGNSLKAADFLKQYEENIKKLGLEFKNFDADIPSFMERYRLYEVWNPQQ